MKYEISIGSSSFSIESYPCSDPKKDSAGSILVEAQNGDCNTLSIISENSLPEPKRIGVWWESHSSAEYLGLHYIPETRVLFIGAGSLSARVDWQGPSLIGTEYQMLFWNHERDGNYVIEYGELDCYLYDLNGNRLAHTVVDPPYEVEKSNYGVRFKSIVQGTTELRYPENDS